MDARGRKRWEEEEEEEEGAQREEGAPIYKAPSLSWERGLGKPGTGGAGGESGRLRVYPEMPSGTTMIVRRKEGRRGEREGRGGAEGAKAEGGRAEVRRG